MSLKLYKEQYQMLEKIAAEMHNANVKMASSVSPQELADLADAPSAARTAPDPNQLSFAFTPPAQRGVSDLPLFSAATQKAMNAGPPAKPLDPAWHAAITDPIRRAAGWVDDHAQSLGGLTGAEAPWLKRTLGYGAPALGAAALGAGAYALANRGGGDPQQGQESLASADLYNAIRQLQAENAEFRAYFQKQASAQTSVNELSLDEKREFFKQASPDQQNQMFVEEVVKTAAAMLTVNGLENGSNPFDPLVIREAAVDLLRSKGYKV